MNVLPFEWAAIAYLVAAVCFILALKGLGSPRTARRGNLIGAAGALIAMLTVFLSTELDNLAWILGAIALGTVVAAPVSRRVKMTQMPQLVALFNGVGGGAAALVALGGDVVVESGPTELIMGDAETTMDIDLVSPVVMAGRAICGQVRLMPTKDLPDGDVAVCWRKSRESHPLTRTPSRGGALDGPIIGLGKHLPLRAGSPLALPFEIALPADAPPTANAVHSSMKWFVQARLFYSGLTAPTTERVLRQIVVVNAP